MGAFLRRREIRWVVFAALFALALAVRGWAALEWEANFNSDEAIFGLMAMKIAEGEHVPTMYGTRYIGSVESYLAGLNFRLFGAGVVPLRAASLSLMALFFFAHAWYVNRVWGSSAALVSLAFVALPGFRILSWTFQPIGGYAAMLAFGTLILILSRRLRLDSRGRPAGLFALGALAGLGLWSNQMIVAYLAAVAFPAFLYSPEWEDFRARLGRFVRTRVGLPPSEVGPALVLCAGAIGVAAFFSGGCEPVGQFARLGQLAKITLAAEAAGLILGLFLISSRRRELLSGAAFVAGGFLVGYSPLWLAWTTGRETPVLALQASCPTGIISRSELLAYEILPEMAGTRPLGSLGDKAGPALAASVAILLLSLSVFVWFIWHYRRQLWSVISWNPPSDAAEGESIVLGLLLLVPLVLSLLSGNTVDIHSIRHLIVSWQAMTVVIGIGIARLPAIPRVAKAVAVVIWAGYVGLSNIAFARTQWPVGFTRFDREAVEQLETHLEGAGVSAGFADYWGAFALDFLTQERITLAPYNGLDRIPAYSELARSAEKVAFIFPLDRRPTDGLSVDALEEYLALENPAASEGPAAGWIRQAVGNYRLQSRTAIAYWDVWILWEE